MQLRDHLFYAYYGRYDYPDAMKRDIALLEQKGVKYKISKTIDFKKMHSYLLAVGGYATMAKLHKALELARGRKNLSNLDFPAS